ncbi:alpha/beta fold hydrolase [Streptomyces sp. HNM0574]|uniref:alpha/beta fold hydrolase n=1 Tax=Streptomyces sp. HNM0574 TaxID=2714954 RepID=UPI00146F116A|nr:alpha/beta fold hydrolase [Streptomyces sp. HNM0574]NLU67461.1 prolyl oligopeptidase family serine peptidase [Streptomyces sp. HNM0574]
MSRRPWLVALSTAALLLPLGLTAPAHAETPGFTTAPLEFTVDLGPGATARNAADAPRRCTVDATLYRPDGADARHRVPALITTNGFGGAKDDPATAGLAERFAERGYAVLAYSGLGFGKSGCRITLDDPRTDGRAASALVDFLGGGRAADDGTRAGFVTRDGRHDPRVGMIGGSYGGAVQLATASVDDRVDALVPMVTWNDLTYSLVPNNTARRTGVTPKLPGAYKTQWTNGFYFLGQIQGLKELATDPDRASLGCVNFPEEMCRTKRMLDSGRFPAGRTQEAMRMIRDASPVSYLHRVKAPTLLVQGQNDTLFNLNEATATYETLRAQGTETRMIWQEPGHSGATSGEPALHEGGLESTYVGKRITAWFDHHLRDDASADTGPAFAWYRDWAAEDGPERAYATSARFPAGRQQRLYLSGDGTLVTSRDAVRRGSATYRNWPLLPSSYSENSLLALAGGQLPPPRDAEGTHLSWRTAPLTAPMDVVGAPEARLRVISPEAERTQQTGEDGTVPDVTGNLVLFAKVYDLAPDGSRTLVKRLVAPARVEDVTRPFTVTLPALAHRYEAGHRLEFVIAAGDSAHYGNRGVKPVTVAAGPGDTGTLDLPVTGGGVPSGAAAGR